MNRTTWIALIVFLILCAIGVILGIYFGVKSAEKDDNVKSNTVFDVSFNASLDIATVQREGLGTEKNYLKVEWNPTTQKMNFKQTEVFTSDYDFDYELSFIMADNKATVTISHMNTSLAFCVQEMFPSQWVSVFQHILTVDNWSSGEKSSKCRGDIWYTKYMNDNVEICSYNNQLQYVIYQTKQASVTSWTITDEQYIQIRSDVLDGPCNFINKASYSDENIPPIVKRDSGIPSATCLFVHGAGENAAGNNVIHNFPSYWGDMRKYTSKCASHKFLVYNSKNNGWDNDQIHQHFCDVAATNGTISNTVIFSHSMGNLVIAAALYRQKCTFNQATSRWFSVQGPWTGSVVAETLSKICRNPSLFQKLIRRVLRGQGYCKPTEDREFDVYTTLKTNYISPTGIRYHHLVQMGKRFVSGVMCGTSSWGLGKNYIESTALYAMQWYSNLQNPNDGMVAFESCKLNDELFETRNYRPYFKDKFNHADGTCRNGGCPCKWYEYMH